MKTKIHHAIDKAMTVADLIEFLEGCDLDARVLFACDYGDYHHTQQALPVTNAEESSTDALAPSAYSHSGIALIEPDDECEPTEDEENVVILC